jgi:predicted transcriptional regulator
MTLPEKFIPEGYTQLTDYTKDDLHLLAEELAADTSWSVEEVHERLHALVHEHNVPIAEAERSVRKTMARGRGPMTLPEEFIPEGDNLLTDYTKDDLAQRAEDIATDTSWSVEEVREKLDTLVQHNVPIAEAERSVRTTIAKGGDSE